MSVKRASSTGTDQTPPVVDCDDSKSKNISPNKLLTENVEENEIKRSNGVSSNDKSAVMAPDTDISGSSDQNLSKILENKDTMSNQARSDQERKKMSENPNMQDEKVWWKWIILFCSFVINFIIEGTISSFGVMYTELWSYFGGSKSRISWIGSLFFSLPLICGAFASLIAVKFGCRFAVVLGSVIVTAGIIASVFANTVEHLYITFGLIAGSANSLPYFATTLILSQYFDNRLGLVNGIAECGSGIGTIVLPITFEALISNFGWRGTFLIMSGFTMNMIVCGCLYREKKTALSDVKEEHEISISSSSTETTDTSITEGRKREEEFEIQNDVTSCTEEHAQGSDCQIPQEPQDSTNDQIYPTKPGTSEATEDIDDIPKCVVISETSSDTSLASDSNEKEDMSFCMTCFTTLKLDIFKNAHFVAYSMLIFMLYIFIDVPYVFLPDRGLEVGLGRQNAALLLTILGVLQLIGNLLFGFIGDVKFFNNVIVFGCCTTLSGAALALVPLTDSFVPLALCAGAFGFFTAASESMCSVMVVEFLGRRQLGTGYGYTMMIKGTSELFGPPLGGWLYDLTGNYDYTFYVAGGSLGLCGVLYTIVSKVISAVTCKRKER